MPDRAEVLAFAQEHGAAAAAAKFGVSAGTIRSWRSRARKRAGRQAAASSPGPDTPAGRFTQEAQRIVEWAASGHRLCLQCGGAGRVTVPASQRHGQAIRPEHSIPCPSCGGTDRGRIIVTEHPATVDGAWAAGMALFGDLTRNLRERDAARLLAWRPPNPMPEQGSGGRSPFQAPGPGGRYSPMAGLAQRAAEQRADAEQREGQQRAQRRGGHRP